MITKIFSKKQMQAVLKDLKHAGYSVNKEIGGRGNRYVVYLDSQLVLDALEGTRGYLTRYDKELLTAAN